MIEVTFNPTKTQNREYVRVRFKFDVSKPVRRSKVVNLPSGEVTTVWYDYERLQKRCYACQRLTHEKEKCPIYRRKLGELSEEEKQKLKKVSKLHGLALKKNDPLFGVSLKIKWELIQ